MKNKLRFIALVALTGLFSLTICACASRLHLTIEDIEEGKAFYEPYLGLADYSKPIQEQSIVINLFKFYSFKPDMDSKEVISVVTNVSSIDGKEVKIPTGSKTDNFEDVYKSFHRNQIVVLPPGKHTFRIWAVSTYSVPNVEIGDSYFDYFNVDLLPGKIYIIRSGFKSGFFNSWCYSYIPFLNSITPPEVVIEIADPNKQLEKNETPLEVNGVKVTMEQIIRGVNAKFAKK